MIEKLDNLLLAAFRVGYWHDQRDVKNLSKSIFELKAALHAYSINTCCRGQHDPEETCPKEGMRYE